MLISAICCSFNGTTSGKQTCVNSHYFQSADSAGQHAGSHSGLILLKGNDMRYIFSVSTSNLNDLGEYIDNS